MDTTTASLLGTALGALAGLLGTIVSNSYLMKKEQVKWFNTQKAEKDQWIRVRIQEVAEHCLHHLATLLARRAELPRDTANLDLEKYNEWYDSFSWAQKWLTILLVYWEVLNEESNSQFKELVEAFSAQPSPNLKLAEKIRTLVIEFATREISTQFGTKRG
ncbi:MAG: hypothetical protein U1F76_04810 [Candidatus Competibacteraceae bacterium]